MRLGQGFNSYTQQICVDDAVVINNDRAENVLLNDGTTMRILAQTQAKPSAWTRQKEVLVDDRTVGIKPAPSQLPRPPKRVEPEAIEEPDIVEPTNSEEPAVEESNIENDTHEQESPTDDDTPVDTPAGTVDSASESAHTQTAEERDTELATGGQDDTVAVPDPAPAVEKSESPTSKPVPATIKKSAGRQRSASVGGGNKSGPSPNAKADRQALQAALARRKLREEKEAEERERLEQEKLKEAREHQRKLEAEAREEDRLRRQEERDEQRKIRSEKRAFEEQRRKDMYKAINDAAAAKNKALSMDEMKAIAKQNQFAERWNGMLENTQDFIFDGSAPRGPSQTVTYTSRFVDRLSDITDDMCISGSLSIKAAKIGGSGRGSFIDSDKFKESDLNFYISVKVVNQTVNFKDALEFNPLRSVDQNNFAKVYGDSFISGFQEGGEFNALVSMKILNKAKKTDIQAEAKVAFTAGPMSVEAEANVGIARENIETNTETTIQVSWMGGGHIKPMEQQWDIKSLMQAAARFPDLVADCPQRTYAILTKYENLRSFVARKPASYSKLQYENAQLYTNVLMEAFMSYKTLYKQISDYMFQIRQKTMEIVPWEKKDAADAASKAAATEGTTESLTALVSIASKKGGPVKRVKDPKTGLYPFVQDYSRFEATMGGLDEARKSIRRQMSRIVNEVDNIENDPKLATDEDHEEPFQPPATFEMRVPTVDIPERLRPKEIPLTGRRIQAKPQTEEERKKEAKRLEDLAKAPALHSREEAFEPDEIEEFAKCVEQDPSIGHHVQVTRSVGSTNKANKWFNHLDFLREDWHIRSIKIRVSEAVVRSLTVEYENGLVVQRGGVGTNGHTFELSSLIPGERITSGAIETGHYCSADNPTILSIQLFTNRGRSLVAQSAQSKPLGEGRALKDGHEFDKIKIVHFDNPFSKGTLKGFYGRDQDATGKPGVYRLGCIWGDILPEALPAGPVAPPNSDLRRIIPSRYGQTGWTSYDNGTGTHGARFGITYPTSPKVIYALSEVRSTHSSANEPAGWNMGNDGVPDVTTTGFTSTTRKVGGDQIHIIEYSWLSLPDNEVNFNVGYHDFESEITDSQLNASGSYNVVFAKEYKTVPATPAIWCVSLDYTGGGHLEANPRLVGSVSNLTTKGFTLTIKSWGGSRHAGNVWGWCVWDKEYDGIKVKAGTKDWGTFESTSDAVVGKTQFWQPDFGNGKGPVSIMTGISGFDLNIESANHMLHLESKYTGSLDNGRIRFAPDASVKARWMQAMYVAILED
ncbi:hypothetical protein QBC38DRAFT_513609 [Podospora fimiseda]|uniref:Jacalin-type lectin domain-containing protein n=1 Tax=Podospora fimiseda TaxID=252190 RepID=A0AAN6YRC5_9PEZI|nr:hypothetical protein QBC38DRAFT_513609 [Podospora fimiseda]